MNTNQNKDKDTRISKNEILEFFNSEKKAEIERRENSRKITLRQIKQATGNKNIIISNYPSGNSK